jgi:membrane protein DedA with SNARE-associated domain
MKRSKAGAFFWSIVLVAAIFELVLAIQGGHGTTAILIYGALVLIVAYVVLATLPRKTTSRKSERRARR